MSVAEKTYQNAGNPAVTRWVEPEDRSILDLGCGAGDNARILAHQDRTIEGVTMSDAEAGIAAEFMRAVYMHNLEGGLPAAASGPYDVVIASHVLEHICFPAAVLQGVRARLSPRGRLIVALPNLLMLKYRIRLLMGIFEYECGGIMDDTHFRWYTFASGRKLLERAGFQVIHASVEGHLPLGPLRKILPSSLQAWLDRAACAWWPGLFGSQLIYVAKPVR